MKQRIQTSILAFLIFIPLVVIGGIIFELFVYLLAVIALMELTRMRNTTNGYLPVIFSVIFLVLLLLPESVGILQGIEKPELLMLFVLILLSYTVVAKNKFTFDDAGFILLTIVYVGMGFYYLIETRDGNSASGLANLFYVLVVIWATDTGAYFFGRAFGNRKLWPKISPNKTIEGAIGGIVLATLVGIIFHIAYPFSYDIIIIIAVTILVSIAGQIGDLVESAYKRYYDVKDSGKLLPGHGGILDRLDSLLFVLPLLHFINFFT
ncbi:phosphatidate cytidylyltransferase [Lentibacillus sp. CBA3610]|uniref:phosphatidate cytidylyltransferase n=1 Tax=Lentibacillus sp. CBA3610 TaxID=2518176 RepID=UPI001596348F|nr:phosphatidate cytidylyltransferase [Lentibacillus sp. CBA3610]QKY69056.1 phosphatidate cytidylyltransferase [Lentibacillus sp. CBA3610]